MTEADWLASEDPAAMLTWANTPASCAGRPWSEWGPSDRKLRLFACACWRAWDAVVILKGEGSSKRPAFLAAADRADRYADGLGLQPIDEYTVCHRDASRAAALSAEGVQTTGQGAAVPPAQIAALLRDIIGNPFRPWMREDAFAAGATLPGPKLNIVWRRRLTSTVVALATAAYDDRQPDGSLDNARLAVLSDALEEAGCVGGPCPDVADHMPGIVCQTCQDTFRVPHPILLHLRSPGPHVRGCWALDLILGNT